MDISNLLENNGEMGRLILQYDWSRSPLGPIDAWPLSLISTVSNILNSRFPAMLLVGSEYIQLYNDAYAATPVAQQRHPWLLGQPAVASWPDAGGLINPLLDKVRQTREAVWAEDLPVPTIRDGALVQLYWTFSFSPVLDEQGNVQAILILCVEATSKVALLQQLQQSDRLFKNLVRETNVGLIVLEGEEMVTTLVNDAYAGLIGLSSDALMGRKLFEIIPDAREKYLPILLHVLHTGETSYLHEDHFEIQTPAGKNSCYLHVRYQPYRAIDGSVIGVMVVCYNITEQVVARIRIHQTEENYRSTAERLELAQAAGKLGSYELILSTMEVIASAQLREHFGVPAEGTLTYDQLVSRIVPEDQYEKHQSMLTAMNNNQPYTAEYRVQQPDGGVRWIRVSGSPVYNEQGQPHKVVGVTFDITRERLFSIELSRQVQERTEQLKRSNDDLLHFAHVTSHDLKEPIRKVKLFSNRLADEFQAMLPDKATGYLHKIQHATDRLLEMIEGILAYSTLDHNNEPLVPVDLMAILSQIEVDLEVPLQQQQATIHRDTLPPIEGDSTLLYQLFYNLVSNALRFAKPDLPPVITITSIPVEDNTTPGIAISVADNGIGFDNKYSSIIFNNFTRLKYKPGTEGTGLGLALCNKIVNRHHGTIQAHGKIGEGAVFTVWLPLKQP
jgi:PAS domain S-box-containing protein